MSVALNPKILEKPALPNAEDVKLETPVKQLTLSLIDTDSLKQSLTEAHDALTETFSYLKMKEKDISAITEIFEQTDGQFTQILKVLGNIQTYLDRKNVNEDLEREVLQKINAELNR